MSRPTYLTSFIGRKSELADIQDILRAKKARLVTLSGPGGSGKTRLADEAARELTDLYEDGVAWVDLVGLRLPSAVPQAIASALEINIPPGQSVQGALTGGLHPREMLIVLDNCEQVAEACVKLLDVLLRDCPAVYVLATSRTPLGVQGEHLWPVPPMAHPAAISASQSMENFDAVKLFQARAKQVRPEFDLEKQDRAALIEILSLLDGQPLAIELAAARLNVLELPQMVAKLQDQLSFLRDHGERGEGRHRSMAAAIRWSYELLAPEEGLLFRRLGAFSGGFSLEAAEVVCGSRPLDSDGVLDLLDALIRQSLVVRVKSSGSATRFRLLEAVRQFAVKQLEDSGEKESVKNLHQRYYADLCRQAEAFMLGPDQHHWTQLLEEDYENIQSALQWAFEKVDRDEAAQLEAARMVASLYWPWNYSERYAEAIGWMDRTLSLPAAKSDNELYADLLHFQATFIWLSGDYPGAQRILAESLELCEAIGYEHRGAHVRLMSGILTLHEKFVDEAIDKLEQSEEVFRRIGDNRGLSIARTNLGSAYMERGELQQAREYAEQAVAGARANQDPWGQGLGLQILGNVVHRQGDPQGALPLFEEAVGLLDMVGQRWLEAEALWRQAEVLHEIGETDQAVRKLERCFELSQEIGATEWQLSALASLGFIALDRSKPQRAIGYFIQIFRLAPPEGYRHIQAQALLGATELAARAEKWEWALELWRDYQAASASLPFEESKRELELRRSLDSQVDGVEIRNIGSESPPSSAASEQAALEYLHRLERQAPVQSSAYELRLLGLGPTEVFLQGEQLVASDWTFAKPKELLYYLATNPPRTKEEIGIVFWPEASPDQLRAGLRAALYHLRKALGDRDWVLYEDGQYRFNRDKSYWYDLEAFEAKAQQGERLMETDPAQAIVDLQEAASLYHGDFIADIADDAWAAAKREELRRQYLDCLGRLSELLILRDDFERAEDILHELIHEDPLLEEAHRQLMRCYAERGEQGLLSRHYESVVELLQEEMGVDPSEETTSLYRSLLQTNT